MSWQPAPSALCENAPTCTPLDQVIEPRAHDIGGLEVRRALPLRERRMVGPFIFFDQMGPARLSADQGVKVRPHPHIGLSTLTWLFEGSIMHRDSLGYVQEIKPGEVNWMTAGSGIVHSERTPEKLEGQEKNLSGLQVWLALPRDKEEIPPSFQHFKADELPTFKDKGLSATLVAGTAWGKSSPVSVFSDTLYVDATLKQGASLALERDHEDHALYLISGRIELAGEHFGPGKLLVLKPEARPKVKALEDSHLILIGGAPLDGPRHIWWNFVSSRKERIEQAKADWREGRFRKVPDDDEFIPLPED